MPSKNSTAGVEDASSGHASSLPNRNKIKDLEEMESIHKEIATELLEGEDKTGLQIFEDYNTRQGNILSSFGPDDGSVFHVILRRMAYNLKHGSDRSLVLSVPTVTREFLEHLVIRYQELLNKPDEDGFRPLDKAAVKLKPVVFLMADLILPVNTLKKFQEKCACKQKTQPGATCDLELPLSLRSAFKVVKDRFSDCLHDTVNLKEVGDWSSRFKDSLSRALEPQKVGDYQGPSKSILHILLEDDNSFNTKSCIKSGSFQRLIELCSIETLKSKDGDGNIPLHKAISLYDKKQIDFNRLHSVITTLIKQCPDSVYETVNEHNPYTMLQKFEPSEGDASDANHKEKQESWRKTETLIKHTCIGSNFNEEKKLNYLYGGRKNGKKIYLNMSYSNRIDGNFVEELSNTVNFRFDTALEYVSLHCDSAKINECHSTLIDATAPERNPYAGIFKWLHEKCLVEKIFKVIVEDLVSYPHTDKEIRNALEPFKIEEWDWRKLDISSQTIILAANEVRHVHLQSSGNEAVLHSWASQDGLAMLPNLESVSITMHPNLREANAECQSFFDDFEHDIRRWRPELKTELKWAADHLSKKTEPENKDPNSGTHQSDQSSWVQAIKPFVNFLDQRVYQVIEDEKRPHVSIALIDNGVCPKAGVTPELLDGKSYYGDRSPELPFRDYYIGPSVHGTQMATFINQVCPMVHLYVVRMDDSKPQSENFTLESAIKAVEWATEMDVDIISMSWTFHKEKASQEQVKRFSEAIQKASHGERILFNSLNDKDTTTIDNLLPTGLDGVIRIGSATKWGEKIESRSGAAHFLFPGKDIPIQNADNEGDNIVSGSSVATAFAAGLAGLIIYTARALAHLDNTLPSNDLESLERAAKKSGIERIFKVIGGKLTDASPSDVFVNPDSFFPDNPDNSADGGRKAEVLKGIFNRLLLLK